METEVKEAFDKARKEKMFGSLSFKLRAGEPELIRFEYTKLMPNTNQGGKQTRETELY